MLITGIAHVNLTVLPGTLHLAKKFYDEVLGFTSVPVPVLQKDHLAWFDITPQGQQIHISDSASPSEPKSSRHPCFRVASPEALVELQKRIWAFYESEEAGEARPREADKPGEIDSGAKGVEYPIRFFARDFAGNRLEFSS
ncbi:putative glyoxalase family protein [Botrytis fragariae]|uniref:Putative glyoxalase family protein n=1 Tax=Botrytis fragariae TaxID=1964551 RepID=A0A8H6EMK6_9HELO|nr:putative glyoxalase family protein [Botrytis fragariae]KAF5877425.1 putative glyoxalase family protein [Botrytis fragariae]